MTILEDQYRVRSRIVNERLKTLRMTLEETKADCDKLNDDARHFQERLAKLDSTDGDYQRATNSLRNIIRQITLANHDIEIAVSAPYFEEKLRLEPFATLNVEAAGGIGFSIMSQGKPSLLLQLLDPHDACHAMGTDDIAARQDIQITNTLQESYTPHVWTALGLGVKGLSYRLFLSRGARLCQVVPELDMYERVFPVRLQIMTRIHSDFRSRVGKPINLTEHVGNVQDTLDELGIDLHLYDVHVGQQLSFFGRAIGQEARPFERYEPLPRLEEGWSIGLKIHKRLLEARIHKLKDEIGEIVRAQAPAPIISSVSFGDIIFDSDNAIRLHTTAHFKTSAEISVDYEVDLGPIGDLTGDISIETKLVKVTAEIWVDVVLKISLLTVGRNEIWVRTVVEHAAPSEPDVDVDPDWLEKQVGSYKDDLKAVIRDRASQLLPEGAELDRRKLVSIAEAQRVHPKVTEGGFELRIVF